MVCSTCGRTAGAQAQYCSSCGAALMPADGQFHAAAQPSRLVRPREGRMVGGVCAGIALAYGWDLTVVRLVVALSVLFTGVPLLVYLVAWVVMPGAPLALPAQTGAGPGSMGM